MGISMHNAPDDELPPERQMPWTALGFLLLACALIAHEAWLTDRPEKGRYRRGRQRAAYMPRRERAPRPRLVVTDFARPEPAEAAAEEPCPEVAAPGGGETDEIVPAAVPSAEPLMSEPAEPVASRPAETGEPVLEIGELVVGRIVHDPSDPDASFAEILGRAVRAGEEIGGHRVHRVEPDRVLLGADGEIVLMPRER